MTMHSYRDTWAEVSLDDIRHNISTVKSMLREPCRLMAVVKADGYGHGAVEVAQAAVDAGASDLGVAFLDEALALVHAGITRPILLLGYTPPRAVEEAIRNDIAITVFSEEAINAIAVCCNRLGRKARIHLKVDTGMTRLGVATADDAYRLASLAMASGNIELEGIFTHFADADNRADDSYTRAQFDGFIAIIAELERRNIRFSLKHCCNSAATLNFPEMHLDMVRAGIVIYGLLPSGKATDRFKQAMSLRTRVSALKYVPIGTAVGYGCRYRTEGDSVIATLPIGYADGLSRRMSNNGSVLIGGRQAPIVGTICMDQTMIDVTDIPGVRIGDEATIFGVSEGRELSVGDVARSIETIPYEVVCAVGKRVPRIYAISGQTASCRRTR
ncbi:alanine racemase [Cohnella herbarum]|uniref:Alanine racemase n=1 Tax=Cohnella herbarum TaxID=2728023 RepID=A0A7Z2ZPH6_9BACL|nr:alanine racemase [Cohnella herbarum]QJD86900.1 alanine racemase [Cohnella herbarum]